jgi:hypothetical protein
MLKSEVWARVLLWGPGGDSVGAHFTGLERLECALCYRGLVYIGHHELTEEGEEIEVVEAVPCRRCSR